jgi:enediyne biosynthesis protein E5
MRKDRRIPALRRFAIAITVLNLLGHLVLGFEQSWTQLLVALGAAYLTEIVLETIDAWANRRTSALQKGPRAILDFMLPAHITGLAVSMLLYANDRLTPFAFAAALGIASKAIFRAPVEGGGWRHFLNPSNTGIGVTLLVFSWVGISPPYQFTENVTGALDWVIPGVLVCAGTLLNGLFTGKLPLIAGWLGGFALQALIRSMIFGTPVVSGLMPMTGMAFLLFTFYMVSDPGTTPDEKPSQVLFGMSVAAAYGVLTAGHVAFGLFFALLAVCSLRGLALHARAMVGARSTAVDTGQDLGKAA